MPAFGLKDSSAGSFTNCGDADTTSRHAKSFAMIEQLMLPSRKLRCVDITDTVYVAFGRLQFMVLKLKYLVDLINVYSILYCVVSDGLNENFCTHRICITV